MRTIGIAGDQVITLAAYAEARGETIALLKARDRELRIVDAPDPVPGALVLVPSRPGTLLLLTFAMLTLASGNEQQLRCAIPGDREGIFARHPRLPVRTPAGDTVVRRL